MPHPATMLIDGNNMFARAFYASLQSGKATQLNGVIRFFEMWRTLHNMFYLHSVEDLKYCFVFDGGSTIRKTLYPAYKAHRGSLPEEYIPQLNIVMCILGSMGIPTIRIPGYEADDIIATLIPRCPSPIMIVTRDKDLMQLIQPDVHVFDSQTSTVFNDVAVQQKFGVPVNALRMYLAICGDSADNIPGVKGYGPVRAQYIASHYPTPKDLFAKLDADGIPDLDGPCYLWELNSKRKELELSYTLIGLHTVPNIEHIQPLPLTSAPAPDILAMVHPFYLTVQLLEGRRVIWTGGANG